MPCSSVLIGFPGCGKTTYGKQLALLLGHPFLDTDALLLENFGREGETIGDLYRRVGEEAFRECEYQVLQGIDRTVAQVIATGGGIVLTEKNRLLLKKLGSIIYLNVPKEVLLERWLQRGLPAFCEGKDPSVCLVLLMKQRAPLYEAMADRVVGPVHVHEV